jgi:hypothetical protein
MSEPVQHIVDDDPLAFDRSLDLVRSTFLLMSIGRAARRS